MKRSLLLLLLGFGAIFSAVADDRPVADQELIAEFKEFCEEMAEDDGTAGMSLPEYLLVCINDELDSEGFQPITEVPN
jgi:hypothetical protein